MGWKIRTLRSLFCSDCSQDLAGPTLVLHNVSLLIVYYIFFGRTLLLIVNSTVHLATEYHWDPSLKIQINNCQARKEPTSNKHHKTTCNFRTHWTQLDSWKRLTQLPCWHTKCHSVITLTLEEEQKSESQSRKCVTVWVKKVERVKGAGPLKTSLPVSHPKQTSSWGSSAWDHFLSVISW